MSLDTPVFLDMQRYGTAHQYCGYEENGKLEVKGESDYV